MRSQEIPGVTVPAPPLQSHKGRCGQCRAKVDFRQIHCPRCGAEWVPPVGKANPRSLAIFCSVSLLTAVIVGLLIRFFFTRLIDRDSARIPDFVDFVGAYLWVSSSIMILVLATFLFEMSSLNIKGHWQRALPQP